MKPSSAPMPSIIGTTAGRVGGGYLGPPILPGRASRSSVRHALWREASGRAVDVERQRVANEQRPAKRFAEGRFIVSSRPPRRSTASRGDPARSSSRRRPAPGSCVQPRICRSHPSWRSRGRTIARSSISWSGGCGGHDVRRRRRERRSLHDLGGSSGRTRWRVFAYECNPELIGFLRRNIAMNWFDDRVRLIAKAAHRDDEERLFQVPRDLKMLGSLTRFDGVEAVAGELQEFQVSCERLDVGLAEVPYVDLLKIDVEGGEAAVLDGASRLLDDGKIGVIAMEYRESALREELREEMDKQLTSLAQDRGATFHVPGDPRRIPLDEVLTVFEYTQLLIRFPGASIEP